MNGADVVAEILKREGTDFTNIERAHVKARSEISIPTKYMP